MRRPGNSRDRLVFQTVHGQPFGFDLVEAGIRWPTWTRRRPAVMAGPAILTGGAKTGCGVRVHDGNFPWISIAARIL